jgi:O-antigen/teichoic acid export membrane protein
VTGDATILESTPTSIGVKAVRSAAALGVRQVLVQGLNAVTGIVLARLLSPSQFGLFGIVTFVLTFLVAFGDVGLGASLIREAGEPGEEDYRAVFTAQQLLVLAVVIAAWFVSPLMARAYHIAPHQAILFRLVALSLLFTSFQVVPSVRLERHLEFQKLAAVEVAQAVVYSGVTIGTALAGLGPLSFALGLLCRSITGAAIINWVSPWRIGWRWDSARIRRHLAFGVPYQGIAFSSLLKDSITPVFVGLALGTSEVGYINWAGMVAAYPVMALMVLQRVYLPAFARMQVHREHLGEFVERVILATNALVAPLAIITLVLIRPITTTVFGAKWLVALPLFQILWLANLLIPTSTPLMGLLNALGRSRTTFAFAAGWMLGTWALGVPLILYLGTIGFALANFLVTLSALALFRVAEKQVKFRIVSVILPPWLLAGAAGVIIFIVQSVWPAHTVITLAGYGAAGLLLFGLGMMKLYAREISRLGFSLKRHQPAQLVESAPNVL